MPDCSKVRPLGQILGQIFYISHTNTIWVIADCTRKLKVLYFPTITDNGKGNGNYYSGLYRDNGKGNGNYFLMIGLSRQPPPLDKRGLPCLKLITVPAVHPLP